ncbi:HAMP domain-containing histidine kinase [Leptolyngbya sp. NK1-12]|uniref:histidine kinase n=1 Tax=Leptolyngbya sp. NK1-12 TaxID=2547451 RepID=A0AA96WR67_9CYAN|nr:HAMP domain-containing sensor histidine kinase [Leptolyngbya sp. NK1-12]WNZ27776.1 HAMP domain-containing histidine kinase [Leptolyngbya sp. NK1-12]
MQFTQAELISPSDKVVPLSKQRLAESRHQQTRKTVPTSAPVTVEQHAAMIVHEMRSPLCVILNVLEACQKMPLNQLEQTRLLMAVEEAERLKRMTDQILAYAHASHASMLLWQDVRLVDLIHEVIQLSADLTIAASRQIVFVPMICDGVCNDISHDICDGTVKGDRDKLKQVFLNLLVNACEAVHPGEVITIQVQVTPRINQISMQIRNGGTPIPPHLIAALGHYPVTTKSSGHGLGLMIVREIIAAHAGTVEIQSSKQLGTTVCVRLPLIQTVSEQ